MAYTIGELCYLDSTASKVGDVMQIDPNKSIFIQLADFIRFEIYSGKRKPNSRLESIREMAIILEVNPNTIKRVYQVLEEEGLIYCHSTLGYFVCDSEAKIKENKQKYVTEQLKSFITILKNCNVSKEEIKQILGDIHGDY